MDVETVTYLANCAKMECVLSSRGRSGSNFISELKKYQSFTKMTARTAIQKVHEIMFKILKSMATMKLVPTGVFPKVILHVTYAGETYFFGTNDHTVIASEAIASTRGSQDEINTIASLLRSDLTQVLKSINETGATAVVVVDVPFGVPIQATFFKIVSFRYDESKASFVDSEMTFSSVSNAPPARPSQSFLLCPEYDSIDVDAFMKTNRLQHVDFVEEDSSSSQIACSRCIISTNLIKELRSQINSLQETMQARACEFQLELMRCVETTRESVMSIMQDDLGDVYTRFESERSKHERLKVHFEIIKSELESVEDAGPPTQLTNELARLRGLVLEFEEERQSKKTASLKSQKKLSELERQIRRLNTEKCELVEGLRLAKSSWNDDIQSLKNTGAEANRTASNQLAQLVDRVRDLSLEKDQLKDTQKALEAHVASKEAAINKAQKDVTNVKKKFVAMKTTIQELELGNDRLEHAFKVALVRRFVRVHRRVHEVDDLKQKLDDATTLATSSAQQEEKTETTKSEPEMTPEAASALLNCISNAISLQRRLENFVIVSRGVPAAQESAYAVPQAVADVFPVVR